ncbi:MAG TPA: hypothetical protein VFN92_10360 [Solirubrobacterales bacterium]|nr:hypothetical protein [Solirubrobacterales bacterium]
MLRSGPPAPLKTALITLLVAVAIAVAAAGRADAHDAGPQVPQAVETTHR